VFPAEGRQVLQQRFIDGMAVTAQRMRRALQVDRVPQHNSRRHQVKATGPVTLLRQRQSPIRFLKRLQLESGLITILQIACFPFPRRIADLYRRKSVSTFLCAQFQGKPELPVN